MVSKRCRVQRRSRRRLHQSDQRLEAERPVPLVLAVRIPHRIKEARRGAAGAADHSREPTRATAPTASGARASRTGATSARTAPAAVLSTATRVSNLPSSHAADAVQHGNGAGAPSVLGSADGSDGAAGPRRADVRVSVRAGAGRCRRRMVHATGARVGSRGHQGRVPSGGALRRSPKLRSTTRSNAASARSGCGPAAAMR